MGIEDVEAYGAAQTGQTFADPGLVFSVLPNSSMTGLRAACREGWLPCHMFGLK